MRNVLCIGGAFNKILPKEEQIKFDEMFFSGGEPHIRLLNIEEISKDQVTVFTRMKSMDDFGMLMVAMDALKRSVSPSRIALFMPYLPGARQDRVCNPGEALTSKVFADAINAMGFSLIGCFDPHSLVAYEMYDNRPDIDDVIKSLDVLEGMQEQFVMDYDCIVMPDKGSVLKHKDNEFWKPTVECSKVRDSETGVLSGFAIDKGDPEGKNCMIIDDICDGGGTFIGLAKVLKEKGAKSVSLCVTHGIFSKGFKELKKHLKNIYVTESMAPAYPRCQEEESGSEIVHVYKFE